MAITNCAECGAEVSTDAPSCPKCGFRVGAKRIRVWQSLLLGAVAIAAAAYAFALGIARRFPEATDEARRAVEIDPGSYISQHSLALTCNWSSDHTGAIAAAEAALAVSGRHLWALADLATALAASGKPGEAEAIYEELVARSRREHVQPTWFAVTCVAVGKTDEAFSSLERAYRDRDPYFGVSLKHWPDLDPIRGDPRFAVLVERVGLGGDP